MTALLPPGTRWGDLTDEQRAALPVGTVLGPSQHDGSTRLVLTEKVTVRRVWMDDDGHPVTFPRLSRVMVSYPPDRDGTSPTDARSLALEEAARECEGLAALYCTGVDSAGAFLTAAARNIRNLKGAP